MSEYCKYCGTSASNARTLLNGWCSKHPAGQNKGKHALYEGGERKEYFCIYCGQKFHTLSSLLSAWCNKHPDGQNKGKHVAYDGRESGPYECKYCGREFRDIASMVGAWCPKHPPGVRSIPRVPIAVNTVQRGSAAREIPAERERVASVGRFCGVAQEHSLHDEELGG